MRQRPSRAVAKTLFAPKRAFSRIKSPPRMTAAGSTMQDFRASSFFAAPAVKWRSLLLPQPGSRHASCFPSREAATANSQGREPLEDDPHATPPAPEGRKRMAYERRHARLAPHRAAAEKSQLRRPCRKPSPALRQVQPRTHILATRPLSRSMAPQRRMNNTTRHFSATTQTIAPPRLVQYNYAIGWGRYRARWRLIDKTRLPHELAVG